MIDFNIYGDISTILRSDMGFKIPETGVYFPDTSERCVEIPYVFSTLKNTGRVLDVGISLADPVYFWGLLELIRTGSEFHAIDIVPLEKVKNRFEIFDQSLTKKINFHNGDIRQFNQFKNYFDSVLCVSVLEHIGFDKYIDAPDTVFDRPFNDYNIFPEYFNWDEDKKALEKILMLLKNDGRLLLTVPFGSGGVYSTKDSKGRYALYIEYNKKKWEKLKSEFLEIADFNERFFQLQGPEGWKEVDQDDFSNNITGNTPKKIDDGVLCVEIIKNTKGR